MHLMVKNEGLQEAYNLKCNKDQLDQLLTVLSTETDKASHLLKGVLGSSIFIRP